MPQVQKKTYVDRIQKIRQIRLANRAKRERDIEKRVGKKLMWNESQIVNYLATDKVPTQMQHCIIKVRDKVSGSDQEKLISAFNICGAVFTRNGYQQNLSMTLTSKGLRNNMMHRRELEAGDKRARYVSIVQRIYGAAIEDLKREADEKSQTKYQQWKQEKKQEKTQPAKVGLQSTKTLEKATTSSKTTAKQRLKKDQ